MLKSIFVQAQLVLGFCSVSSVRANYVLDVLKGNLCSLLLFFIFWKEQLVQSEHRLLNTYGALRSFRIHPDLIWCLSWVRVHISFAYLQSLVLIGAWRHHRPGSMDGLDYQLSVWADLESELWIRAQPLTHIIPADRGGLLGATAAPSHQPLLPLSSNSSSFSQTNWSTYVI